MLKFDGLDTKNIYNSLLKMENQLNSYSNNPIRDKVFEYSHNISDKLVLIRHHL